MEKLIIAGKAKKVFSIIEAIARRHPDMPLSLYNGEEVIGNRIRKRREELGLSQVRLAVLAGLSNSLVSDFELGKLNLTAARPWLRLPWPRAKKALANALGVTEGELFPELEVAKC